MSAAFCILSEQGGGCCFKVYPSPGACAPAVNSCTDPLPLQFSPEWSGGGVHICTRHSPAAGRTCTVWLSGQEDPFGSLLLNPGPCVGPQRVVRHPLDPLLLSRSGAARKQSRELKMERGGRSPWRQRATG